MTLHAERLRTRCRLVVPRRSIRPVSSPTQITEWGTPPSPLALTFAPAPLCAWMSRRMYHPRDCHAHARSHCRRLGFGAVFRLIQLEEVEKPGFGGVSAAPDLGPSGQEPSPSHPSCAGCGASTALAVPATSSDAYPRLLRSQLAFTPSRTYAAADPSCRARLRARTRARSL